LLSFRGIGTPSLKAQGEQRRSSIFNILRDIFEGLHAKVDRIVAAVEGDDTETKAEDSSLQQKLASTEKANSDLKAQAAQARRKTLSPLVTTLLAKEGVEGDALIETPVLEKALGGLSIEQRIAVKAELARAGVLV